jgi:hypothetical protein
MDSKEIFLNESADLKPEMERYLACMDEIKNRWVYVNKLIQPTYSKVEIEHICLHIRMIIESIILANLASHEGYYLKTLHDLAGMWNIHEMLKTITYVNPHFYPIAIKTNNVQIPDHPEANGYIHFADPALSKDELISIHKQCSEYLHPQNPFALEKKYLVQDYFGVWLEKIKQLLSYHSIRLVGGANKNLLIEIDFESPYGTAEDIKIGYLKESV